MISEMPSTISRRRALSIIAGVGALLLPRRAGADTLWLFEWHGTALGAEARIVLYQRDETAATAAIRAAVDEVERLEDEFSLYRPDSALVKLNRDGVLDRPSLDMLRLLQESHRFGELTGGAFDVTVQPLWRLYAAHFANRPDDVDGPSVADLRRTCRRVDFRRIGVAPERITLPPEMAVTLNGIAQGYITDRVAELLRARGWTDVLIDLGELRGLGGHPDGRPWTIGLPDPRRAHAPVAEIPLGQRAAATSAGSGTTFDRAGRYHHLFVPRTGRSAATYSAVTVFAERATVADALSTALSVMPRERAPAVLRRFPGVDAWVVEADGRVERLGSEPA
jgi:FAD:protein FMN transferase